MFLFLYVDDAGFSKLFKMGKYTLTVSHCVLITSLYLVYQAIQIMNAFELNILFNPTYIVSF